MQMTGFTGGKLLDLKCLHYDWEATNAMTVNYGAIKPHTFSESKSRKSQS